MGMIKLFVCMVVYHLNYHKWNKLRIYLVPVTFLIQVCYATSFGQTQILASRDGVKMIVVYRLLSVEMLFVNSSVDMIWTWLLELTRLWKMGTSFLLDVN